MPLALANSLLSVPLFLAQSEAGAAAGGVAALGFMCCFGVFGLAVFGFWLWMLIDVCTKEFDGNEKLIWVLVVVLANWLGALIYFFIGRSKGRKP